MSAMFQHPQLHEGGAELARGHKWVGKFFGIYYLKYLPL